MGNQTLTFVEIKNGVAIFKYTNKNLSQTFSMSPRYYLSDETQGQGDGLYEFRPLKQHS